MMKQVIFSFCLLISIFSARAQFADRQTIGSAGDFVVVNASTNFQSTLGEVVIASLQSGGVILTQGFQQPEQILNLPIPNGGVPLDVSIYPNPAIDQVKVQFNLDAPAWLSFLLVNNAGQVIRQIPLAMYPSGMQEVPFDFQLPAGLYLLTLYYEGRTLTYKVIIQ